MSATTVDRPKLRLTPLTQKQAAKLCRPLECQVQIGYAQWCQKMGATVPELRRGFHVPNGEERDIRVAKKLQRMGVRRSVPDWVLPVARRGYHGAMIEFKRPGEKPTEAQWLELMHLSKDGYAVAWFDEWLDAADWTLWYVGRADMPTRLRHHMRAMLDELESRL